MSPLIKYQKSKSPIKPWVIFAMVYAICTTIALLFLLFSTPAQQSVGSLETKVQAPKSTPIIPQIKNTDSKTVAQDSAFPVNEPESKLSSTTSLSFYKPTTPTPFLITSQVEILARVSLKEKLELLFEKIMDSSETSLSKTISQSKNSIRALYVLEGKLVLDLERHVLQSMETLSAVNQMQFLCALAFTAIHNSNHEKVQLLAGGKSVNLDGEGLIPDFSREIALNQYLILTKE